MRQIAGFTLIEVIVAISIFALIGLGCFKVIHGLSGARDTLTKKTEYLRELSRAIYTIDSDFSQLSRRGITDKSGKAMPPLVSSDGDYLVEFSRHGSKNPLMEKRSEVIRVAYQFHTSDDLKDLKIFGEMINNKELTTKNEDKSGYLVRYVWPVLDRGDEASPVPSIILAGVEGIEFEYLNDKNIWQKEWPTSSNNGIASSNDLPCAVRIKINTIAYGSLERLFGVRPPPDLIK